MRPKIKSTHADNGLVQKPYMPAHFKGEVALCSMLFMLYYVNLCCIMLIYAKLCYGMPCHAMICTDFSKRVYRFLFKDSR